MPASRADQAALLRAQQMMDRNRDKPGAGCPLHDGTTGLTWAALRRLVDLASREARR